MRKIMRAILIFDTVMIGLLMAMVLAPKTVAEPDLESYIPPEQVIDIYVEEEDATLIEKEPTEPETPPEEPDIPEEEVCPFDEDEIKLIAKLVEAEAGNQSELGKRLVIDTVLNRVDHPNFPDTVNAVVYQPYQYSPATSGAIDLYTATEENIRLVEEEIERRTESEVVYFQGGGYPSYGVPLYCIGDHYFSSYD